MGCYAAADGSIRSKGTMYFVPQPHGQRVDGRWLGMSHDGKVVTGWGGIARTEDEARAAIARLKDQFGDLGDQAAERAGSEPA